MLAENSFVLGEKENSDLRNVNQSTSMLHLPLSAFDCVCI